MDAGRIQDDGLACPEPINHPEAAHHHPEQADAAYFDTLFPVDPCAIAGARDIFMLARCVEEAGNEDGAMALLRCHQWSAVYCTLLWAAAGDSPSHALLQWLRLAARHCFVLMPTDEERPAPDLLEQAWLALRTAVRAARIQNTEGLTKWHRLMFGATVRPRGHLREEAQQVSVDNADPRYWSPPLLP